MNRLLSIAVFLVLMAVGAPAVVGAQPLPAGLNTNLTLTHDGVERRFDVFVPAEAASGSAAPLVLDLHGQSINTSQQRNTSGWLEFAQEQGITVAWPAGLQRSWEVPPFGSGSDDVGFLFAVVEELAGRTAVDPAQVHVTGWSLGGFMAQRLACEAADRFGAFVAVAGGTPLDYFDPEDCAPVRPPPVLNFRGRTDEMVPFEGGPTATTTSPVSATVRSALEELEFWRVEAACSAGNPDRTRSLGARSDCRAYTECGEAAEVESCFTESNETFGHDLYSNVDGFDLAAEAWAFMQRHPIPAEFLQSFTIDAAVEGNWADPDALQQGLMFDQISGTDVLFVAWFTYTADAVAPDLPLTDVGAPGQRWLVGALTIDGPVASGALLAPAGGAFLEAPGPAQEEVEAGAMEIEFFGCDRAEVRYTLDGPGLEGAFPIEPIAKIVLPATFDCSPRAPGAD